MTSNLFSQAVPSIRRHPVSIILLLSLIFEVTWFSIENIGFHCDSPAYIQFAWGLLGFSISRLILWVRSVGYPLLIALTGVVGPNGTFHSFLGILLLQAAMAAAIPVLAYKIVEPYSRRVAFLTALLMIVSLQPYITSKLVMTEQPFKFFSMLLIYLAVRAHRAQSPRRWFVALSATCVFLALLRPTAILMAAIVFGALLISLRQYWRSLAASFFTVFAALFLNSLVTCLYLPPPGLYKPELVSRVEDLALYDLFMRDDASAIAPDKGRYRADIHTVLEAFAAELKPAWVGRSPARYFAPYADDPKAWVATFYTAPDRVKYVMFKDALLIYSDQGQSPVLREKARKAIQHVLREAYFREPWRAARLVLRYGLAMPGGGGPEIMYNSLFSGYQLTRFSPDNGPASRDFIETIRFFLTENPTEIIKIAPPSMFKNYTNNPDGLIQDLLMGSPNPNLLYSIWTIMVAMKDPMAAEALYAAVDIEGITNNSKGGPWGVFKGLFDAGTVQLDRFFFDLYSVNFDYFYNLVFCYQFTAPGGEAYEGQLRSGMRACPLYTVATDKVGPQFWFDHVVHQVWMVTHLGANIIVILGAPFAIWSRYRWPFLVILALIFSHAIPSCYIIFAQDRYVDQILPITIILAGFVMAASMECHRRLRRRRPRENVADEP